MNKKIAAYAMLSEIAMNEGFKCYEDNDNTVKREVKGCAYSQCDRNHNHNNACCSAKHYKLWRKEQEDS